MRWLTERQVGERCELAGEYWEVDADDVSDSIDASGLDLNPMTYTTQIS